MFVKYGLYREKKLNNKKVPDLDHDEHDDHDLEARVVHVVQVARQQLHQLAAVAQLLVHHLHTINDKKNNNK